MSVLSVPCFSTEHTDIHTRVAHAYPVRTAPSHSCPAGSVSFNASISPERADNSHWPESVLRHFRSTTRGTNVSSEHKPCETINLIEGKVERIGENPHPCQTLMLTPLEREGTGTLQRYCPSLMDSIMTGQGKSAVLSLLFPLR